MSGRLRTTVASATQGGRTTSYTYNEVGSRLRALMPNGTRTDYRYDVRNRLQQMTHYTVSGSVLLVSPKSLRYCSYTCGRLAPGSIVVCSTPGALPSYFSA